MNCIRGIFLLAVAAAWSNPARADLVILRDGEEVEAGTDPLDPAEFPDVVDVPTDAEGRIEGGALFGCSAGSRGAAPAGGLLALLALVGLRRRRA